MEREKQYLFLKRCITDFDGNIKPMFLDLYDECSGDMEKFSEKIVLSEDENIKMSQAYAYASKEINPDLKHWYRLRSILGDNVRKTDSDVGGLKVGSNDFSFVIPNGYGDGTTRYAIIDDKCFNDEMANRFIHISGNNINIYDYDCGDDIKETISGEYSVYYYDGIIIFAKC